MTPIIRFLIISLPFQGKDDWNTFLSVRSSWLENISTETGSFLLLCSVQHLLNIHNTSTIRDNKHHLHRNHSCLKNNNNAHIHVYGVLVYVLGITFHTGSCSHLKTLTVHLFSGAIPLTILKSTICGTIGAYLSPLVNT